MRDAGNGETGEDRRVGKNVASHGHTDTIRRRSIDGVYGRFCRFLVSSCFPLNFAGFVRWLPCVPWSASSDPTIRSLGWVCCRRPSKRWTALRRASTSTRIGSSSANRHKKTQRKTANVSNPQGYPVREIDDKILDFILFFIGADIWLCIKRL